MDGNAIKDLSEPEIRDMLSSIAWREVRYRWQKEMEERPKLGMLNEIVEKWKMSATGCCVAMHGTS